MERKWWTLLVVCVATFMLLLDITIVNVALPSIAHSLHSSFSDLQWVIDAYALTLASFLLTAGSVSDIFGRRGIFAAGVLVFTVASVGCGLAGSPMVLNLARGVQGIGGAMMFATSLALIAQEFQGRDRGTAFGAWGATTGGAVAVGPLLGGVFTDGLGWESIFFLNVPIGLAVLLITFTRLVNVRPPSAPRIDLRGLVTFSAALFMLIFALVRGNDEGWGSTVIVSLLAGAAILMAAFFVIEARRRDPMFDLSLFRKPTFAGASIAAFALSASMFSLFLYLTLYIQSILGYGPLDAGLRFLPTTLLSFVVAPIAGKLSTRLPARAFLGGGLLLVGLALLLMRGVDASSGWTALLPGFAVAGVGVGLINPPLASTAVGVVAPWKSGMASGINSTFRQVGIATGVAALGAVFQHDVEVRLTGLLTATPGAGFSHQLGVAVAGGGARQAIAAVPPGARGLVDHAARVAFTSALGEIFLIGAVVAIVGGVLSFALVRARDFVGAVGAGQAEGEPAPAAAMA